MIQIPQQNPQRYSKEGNLYKISASDEIEPVLIEVLDETDLEIEGILPFDIRGIIIYLRDYNRYIASNELVDTLAESVSLNPHYTYKEHSKVMGAKMGRTIPIISIDTNKVLTEIEKQKAKVLFSGVKEVEWEINGEDTSNLINQIIWTLSPNAPKPLDTYTTWDLNLSGDYSVTKIPIEPLDENARIPEDKLSANLEIINGRLKTLNSDFNRIKDIFYFGKVSGTSTTRHTVLSASDSGDDMAIQVITKQSEAVDKEVLVSNQLGEVQDKKVEGVSTEVEQAKTTLSQKINQTEATIASAQAGDTAAQRDLARKLAQTESALLNANAILVQKLKDAGVKV